MNAADIVRTREALEEFVRTDGWKIFVAHVLSEWQGKGYVARMGTALASTAPEDPKVVHKASLAIAGLLEWPAARIRDLKGIVEE